VLLFHIFHSTNRRWRWFLLKIFNLPPGAAAILPETVDIGERVKFSKFTCDIFKNIEEVYAIAKGTYVWIFVVYRSEHDYVVLVGLSLYDVKTDH
jgi:hypothetical protein